MSYAGARRGCQGRSSRRPKNVPGGIATAGKESIPGRQLAWRCGSSDQASQAPKKRYQGILLVILQAIEPARLAARLARVATDRIEERDIRAVVHEPLAEPHAPQRRSAQS